MSVLYKVINFVKNNSVQILAFVYVCGTASKDHFSTSDRDLFHLPATQHDSPDSNVYLNKLTYQDMLIKS